MQSRETLEEFFEMIFNDRTIDHTHICPKCEGRWTHSADEIEAGGFDNDIAHTCPHCKEGESYFYSSRTEPCSVRYCGQPDFVCPAPESQSA